MYLKSQLLRAALAASVSSVSLLSAVPAFAQETETAVESPDRDVVVVTAQRREERLQDVPISITVFNQEQLDNRNISGAADLALGVTRPTVTSSPPRVTGLPSASLSGNSVPGTSFVATRRRRRATRWSTRNSGSASSCVASVWACSSAAAAFNFFSLSLNFLIEFCVFWILFDFDLVHNHQIKTNQHHHQLVHF